jgi:endonuclease YncB( thermonuclease family)
VVVLGHQVRLTVARGAVESSEDIRAVVSADGDNINRELIHRGYARYRGDLGGAEWQGMHGFLGRALGRYSENAFPRGWRQRRD